MKLFIKNRIDIILIWGHGLEYLSEILDEIRKEFKILKIKKYKPKNLKKFVKEIYSYDYAPFWHLKAKTNYLLKTPKEVCFIVIKNQNPQEDILGEGKFRHIESLKLKRFKEKIRDKYNPYENGERTHNHIIHTTDSEAQSDYMLKYLGYKQGIKTFENSIKIIDIPYYLKEYKNYEIKKIDIKNLYANIAKGKGWDNFYIEKTKLIDTPQYKSLENGMEIYQNYIDKFLGGPLQDDYNIKRFLKLKDNFEYLKSPYNNSFIIVSKDNNGDYIVLDGLHRACLCYYKQYKEILVCQV